MDIETRKIKFIQEFLTLKNEGLISRLESLLHAEKAPKKENFQPMSIQELNERIEKSLEDSKNGKLTKSSKLLAEIQKWR